MLIANSIQLLLEHYVEPTVWNQGVFEPSSSTLEDLTDLLERIDFGIFVFSPDDVSKIRKQKYLVARDNVIFEMGLFIGRLGKKRVFYIIPRHREKFHRHREKFHLPSDLLGVTPLDYDNNRSDGNIQAALGSPCSKIIERINRLGRIERQISSIEINPNLAQETAIFTSQEEREFNHIYETLKPNKFASISIIKEVIENGKKDRKKIGVCKFEYSLLKVIWSNINNKNDTFEGIFKDFLSHYTGIAQDIIKSNLLFFDSNYSFGHGFNPEDETLIPLLRKFGLLVESAAETSVRIIGKYRFYVYSEKMFRFAYWLDYNKKISDEIALNFVEFIETTE